MSHLYLSAGDIELLAEIERLTNSERYKEALKLVESRLVELFTGNEPNVYLTGSLAGWLIDIGSDSNDRASVIRGKELIEEHYDSLCDIASRELTEHNLGRAEHSLFKIRTTEATYQPRPGSIEELIRAKAHYWRSYKEGLVPHDDWEFEEQPPPVNPVNLGNALLDCFRIVEAIQYCDLALSKSPKFPNACLLYSRSIISLFQYSSHVTTNSLQRTLEMLKAALQSQELPEYAIRDTKTKIEWVTKILNDPEPSEIAATIDAHQTEIESQGHSNYRKYCLTNHLTLSEHGIYCNCKGAGQDDLTIPTATIPIGGSFVPRMEFYLNRIKAEFGLARLFYYQGAVLKSSEWNLYEDETGLSELYDKEKSGQQVELLRSSYRTCFSILDKIAAAICEQFEWAKTSNSLLFESFWRANETRWQEINQVNNPFIVALYSLAVDLNSGKKAENNEWPDFKQWRNAAEHRLLVISESDTSHSGPFQVYGSDLGDKVVSYQEFVERLLLLLRMVRGAIFSFAWCIRHEGLKHGGGGGPVAWISRK